jgi:hypothetical protein
MLTSQKIHYEIGSKRGATPFGGLCAMHRLVTRLGLVDEIDERLRLLKMHLPYHESDHVLTLAYSVLSGGTRLEDVDRVAKRRAVDERPRGEAAAGPDHDGGLPAPFRRGLPGGVDGRDQTRCDPRLWTRRGADLLGEVAPAWSCTSSVGWRASSSLSMLRGWPPRIQTSTTTPSPISCRRQRS